MAWDDDLDADSPAHQIAASENAYIRVVAGPGTGKSFAMKRRVARLLESGVEPHAILPVTFTRVAAEDLHRELVSMGVPGCEELTGTTLHSLALRILMRNHVITATGRVPRPLNEFEKAALEHDLKGTHVGLREVRKKIKAYEAAWARLQPDAPGYVQNEADAAFEQDLISWLKFHRAMLIGEVVPQLYRFLSTNPAAEERAMFSHILVDEYQDLNKAEQAVLANLSDSAEVCIVGDDDQSIYSFKHAHPDGIRVWIDEHTGADDLDLGVCRRCPTLIVNMANALIANNVNRPVPRVLTPLPENGEGDISIIQYATLDAEIESVVHKVEELIGQGVPPGDILVLAQRRVLGSPIYAGLIDNGIPVRSYYAEAELDQIGAQQRFALLKLFVDSNDRVALRWLLGVNSSSWLVGGYRRLREYCAQNAIDPWSALKAVTAGEISIPHTASVVSRFNEIRARVDELTTVFEDHGLAGVIDVLFAEGDQTVRELRQIAMDTLETVDPDNKVAFMRELQAAISTPEIPTEVAEVRIMSLHKSKGLSSPVTIIAGCVEGLLPMAPSQDESDQAQSDYIEEQRRLFYVGITRVRADPAQGKPGTLILTYSRQMRNADAMRSGIFPASHAYGYANLIASRFIAEVSAVAPAPQAG